MQPGRTLRHREFEVLRAAWDWDWVDIAFLLCCKIQVALADGRPAFPDPAATAPEPGPVSFRDAAERWIATYPALAGLR